MDGLVGAKLNSKEEYKFYTEWENASGNNKKILYFLTKLDNHPEYLKIWKASFAIDIF